MNFGQKSMRIINKVGQGINRLALQVGYAKTDAIEDISALQRGDLPEMTGKAWMFVAVIVAVVLLFGPKAISLVSNALGTSLNTESSAFNFTT